MCPHSAQSRGMLRSKPAAQPTKLSAGDSVRTEDEAVGSASPPHGRGTPGHIARAATPTRQASITRFVSSEPRIVAPFASPTGRRMLSALAPTPGSGASAVAPTPASALRSVAERGKKPSGRPRFQSALVHPSIALRARHGVNAGAGAGAGAGTGGGASAAASSGRLSAARAGSAGSVPLQAGAARSGAGGGASMGAARGWGAPRRRRVRIVHPVVGEEASMAAPQASGTPWETPEKPAPGPAFTTAGDAPVSARVLHPCTPEQQQQSMHTPVQGGGAPRAPVSIAAQHMLGKKRRPVEEAGILPRQIAWVGVSPWDVEFPHEAVVSPLQHEQQGLRRCPSHHARSGTSPVSPAQARAATGASVPRSPHVGHGRQGTAGPDNPHVAAPRVNEPPAASGGSGSNSERGGAATASANAGRASERTVAQKRKAGTLLDYFQPSS